jgi:phospholipase C
VKTNILPSTIASGASLIKHVFVLMLENRSLDHMLGWSGITGTDAIANTSTAINGLSVDDTNTYAGVTYSAGNTAPDKMLVDPGHEFTDVVIQLSGTGASYPPGGPYPQINNSGFIASYASQPDYTQSGGNQPAMCMNSFTPTTLPILTTLAKDFVVCDQWFSSMPGATWPNRFFVHAASSGGLDHSPTTPEVVASYTFDGYTFNNGTIFDRLQATGMNWRIYAGDYFPQVGAIKGMHHRSFISYSDFSTDIGDCAYPAAYTFIEPDYGAITSDYSGGNSQHPLDRVSSGEALIKSTYEALRSSPLWDSSVLIVTYDEHGGFYDHVAPPSALSPNDGPPTSPSSNVYGFTFDQYGVRVPAVIVSPLVPANLIDHTLYDHSSVLATLERLFRLSPLTDRDANANDFSHLFSLTAARTDAPLTLPAVYVPAVAEAATTGAAVGAVAKQDSVADRPLKGDEPGFLLVALRQDLSVSPPEERDARVGRFRQARTRATAREYLDEVEARLRASAGNRRAQPAP